MRISPSSIGRRLDLRRTWPQWALILVAFTAAIGLRIQLWPNFTTDYTVFMSPWFDRLKDEGFGALGDDFANYNPVFMYLLAAGAQTGLDGLAVVKLISGTFDLVGSAAIMAIAFHWRRDARLAAMAGVAFLFAPEVVLNSAFWGQIDSIHTALLLWGVYALLRRWDLAAWLLVFVAIACKTQAIFLLPVFVLALWWQRHRWWMPLIGVVGGLAIFLPRVIAGRPALAQFEMYATQASGAAELQLNAANLYQWIPNDLFATMNGAGIFLGLGVAAILAMRYLRTPTTVLQAAAVFGTALPFVLPQMHDRYFFAGNVMALACAAISRRYWAPAAMLQVVALVTYSSVLGIIPAVPMPVLAIVQLAAIAWLVWLAETPIEAPPTANAATDPAAAYPVADESARAVPAAPEGRPREASVITGREQWVDSESRRRPSAVTFVAAATIVLAFAVHFRPWEEGLLEDWGLLQLWEQLGWGGYTILLEQSTIGRPLHLFFPFLGLAITNGGFVGYFLILGLAAVGQVLAVVWGFRSASWRGALPWLVGLILALHPWWPAGEILRFLPAQVGVLGATVAIAAFGWYLRSGRWRWVAIATGATVVGLLTYQALALGQLLVTAAILLIVRRPSVRRRVVVGAASLASVALPAAYAIVLSRIMPSTYEGQLLTGMPDPFAIVKGLGRTILLESPILLITIAVALAVPAVLLLTRAVRRRDAWVLIALAAASPAAGLVYGASGVHLSDPERIALPVGFVCWGVLALTVLAARGRAIAPVTIGSIVGAVVAVTVALVSIATWAGYSATQQDAMRIIQPAVEGADAEQWFVVVDRSGTLGDVYTLYPPYTEIATQLEFDHTAHVTLCTPGDVPRLHPVAATYPIETTPGCDELLAGDSELVLSSPFGTGSLDVYEVEPPQ